MYQFLANFQQLTIEISCLVDIKCMLHKGLKMLLPICDLINDTFIML